MKLFVSLGPGLVLVSVVSLLSLGVSSSLAAAGFPVPLSSLTLAVLFGMAAVPLLGRPGARGLLDRAAPGLKFVSRRVLRLAIVLMGFRLGWDQIAAAGPGALAVVVLGSGLTFAFTVLLGRKWGLPRNRALLLASGTSVCGAAAIAAVDGCLKSREEDVGFALASVTLFGTVLLLVDPLLLSLFSWAPRAYAVWVGASVHEVAQVAAAAAPLDPAGQALASTVKLLRVLLLIPLTLVLSYLPGPAPEGGNPAPGPAGRKVTVPWFALGFFAASALTSLPSFPGEIRGPVLAADGVLLTAAMAALGLGIDFRRFAALDRRSLALAVAPTGFLLVVTGLLTLVWASSGALP